ncbi:MAG: hypothetical protein L3J24_03395 [Xanthomonadales bacterium]|nr:hypothetical protein [Xanthomonadales bacterium]
MNDKHSNKSDKSPQGFRVVPAATGKLWLEEAWQFFRSQTRVLLFAVLLLVLIWSLSNVLVLGMVISILSPIFTAGLLLGIRAGFIKPPARINLLAAWQLPGPRKELVLLGLVLTLLGLLINYLLGPELAELQLAMTSGVASEVPIDALKRVFLFSFASVVIIGFCTWFGLPEIAYRGRPLLSAVLLSVQAILANWRALSVLGFWLILIWLAVVFVMVIVSAVLVAVLSMLGSSLIGTFIISLPFLVISLGMMALMYVLQYVCWRDIFSGPAEEKPTLEQEPQIDHNQDEENTRVII